MAKHLRISYFDSDDPIGKTEEVRITRGKSPFTALVSFIVLHPCLTVTACACIDETTGEVSCFPYIPQVLL